MSLLYRKHNYVYRFDPVPFIKNHKHGRRYREFKTASEKRIACIHEYEGLYKLIRRKRSYKGLPNSWDDYRIHINRCWKRNRKTQFKAKDNIT